MPAKQTLFFSCMVEYTLTLLLVRDLRREIIIMKKTHAEISFSLGISTVSVLPGFSFSPVSVSVLLRCCCWPPCQHYLCPCSAEQLTVIGIDDTSGSAHFLCNKLNLILKFIPIWKGEYVIAILLPTASS